jgi:cytochrome b6-f complex iron-sulfur subunit
MYNNRRGFLRWLALGFGSLVGWLPGFTRRRFALAQGTASGSKASEPEFVKVATLADLKDGPFKVENAFGKTPPPSGWSGIRKKKILCWLWMPPVPCGV